ncbi:MAG: cell division protein FtsX [Bacteroidaceae bacterium]|nr:cell division protein FtsX [Bacteroidaceae bacterium]
MAKRRFLGGMQTITSCISVTLVLVLLGCAVFFGQVMNELSHYMRENLTVTVMMKDDAGDKEVAKYAQFLKSERYVSESKLVTKEEALKEQSVAMGTDPSEFLGVNPFSASIDLNLQSDYANSDSLIWITQKIKGCELVSDVIYQKDLIDNVNNTVGKVAMVLLALAALLAVVSVVLISNTVRLSIYSRRFVIHTMRLVGASWGFIRRPFMLRAFLMGIVSALIANALLVGGAHALVEFDPEVKMFVGTGTVLLMSAVVLIVGLLITMLCSLLTVNRYLRMRESDMY